MNIIKNFSHTVSIGHPNYDDLTDYDSHLYITSSGTISAPIGSSITMRPHGRDDYHVIYIQKGSMKFNINEIEYDMRAGAFAFINYGCILRAILHILFYTIFRWMTAVYTNLNMMRS